MEAMHFIFGLGKTPVTRLCFATKPDVVTTQHENSISSLNDFNSGAQRNLRIYRVEFHNSVVSKQFGTLWLATVFFIVSRFRGREGCMRIAHLSRRLFVKTALAGAAGTMIPRIAIGGDDQAQPAVKNAGPSSRTLSEASHLVRSKKISPVDLTKECLGRIEIGRAHV